MTITLQVLLLVQKAWRAWFMGWFMLNIDCKDDFEVEYSTKKLVQLVQDGEHVIVFMEVDPSLLIVLMMSLK